MGRKRPSGCDTLADKISCKGDAYEKVHPKPIPF